MAEKVKKEKSKLRKTIEWVLIGIFGVAAVFAMAATVSGLIHKKENFGYSIRFGIGTFVVKTNSMEPEIKTGSMIITVKEDVEAFQERLINGETIDVTFFNQPVNGGGVELDTEEFKGRNPTEAVYLPMTHRLREVHVREDIEFGNGKYLFVASGINEQNERYSPDQYQLFTESEYLGTVKVSNSFFGHITNFISSPIGLIILLLVPAGYLIVTSSIDIFKAVKEEEEVKVQVNPDSDDRLENMSEEDKKRLKDELLQEMLKSKKEGK